MVNSVRVNSAFRPSWVGTGKEETLGLPGGIPGPQTWELSQWVRGYYGRTLVAVATAVIETVSLPSGTIQQLRKELPSTSSGIRMGIKQSISLAFAIL